MILQGERIHLRPLDITDADGPYPQWLNDPDVCRYNSHGESLYTREMALAYIRSVTDNPTIQAFAICLNENSRHIGNIALQQVSAKNKSAELAILIGDSSVYGQGIGFESCSLLMTYGFGSLHLHRIHCGTHADNTAMKKLALSLGMREEGKRRDAIFKNGKYADVLEYGILRDEYTSN